MKAHFFAMLVCTLLFLQGCSEASLLDTHYGVKLPQIPQSWETMLGDPHWRLEWINDMGKKQVMILTEESSAAISLPQTWANPVSAAPFWPERGISHGVFKPAGAIFPFDVSDKVVVLSWQGGIDAAFYWELALQAGRADNAAETGSAALRLPYHFNWPRFRQLFHDEAIHEKIRTDPWLANWSDIAGRTIATGFDRRRLIPEARADLHVPVNSGLWIGTSPFADPLFFEETPVFPVRPTVDVWVSMEGILHCNSDTWILLN